MTAPVKVERPLADHVSEMEDVVESLELELLEARALLAQLKYAAIVEASRRPVSLNKRGAVQWPNDSR